MNPSFFNWKLFFAWIGSTLKNTGLNLAFRPIFKVISPSSIHQLLNNYEEGGGRLNCGTKN